MTFLVSDWDGPGTCFTIIDAVSYVDTVEILVKYPLPRGLKGELRKLAGRRVRFDDATRPDRDSPAIRHAYGTTIRLSQPTPEEVRVVLGLCGNKHSVRRVDVACDFHTATPQEAANCGKYLSRYGWQKWRGKKRLLHATENVRYWSADAATTRNVALYWDKPSRKNGEPCAHWEMRFVTAAACRRAGLSNLNQLLEGINTLDLLERQHGLRTLDRNRFFKLTEEQAVKLKRKNRLTLEGWTVPQIQYRIDGLMFAALQEEDFAPDEATIHTARVQQVYDLGRSDSAKLARLARKTLVEVRKWDDFAPTLRWLR